MRTAPSPRRVERAPARPSVVPPQPGRAASAFPELASGREPVTRAEQMIWAVIGVVAFLLRFVDVGHRAMHHDESLHAVYSWNIDKWLQGVANMGYHYDPMMHGPYQFHQNAFFMFLFGGNETAGRLGSVVCGTLLVLTPFLLRRYLGRNGAFVLAALLCLSPFVLYFSRFMREDMPFALWTMLAICAFFRFIERGERHYRWLWLLGAAVALLWSTKESSVIVFAILGGYLVFLLVSELSMSNQPGRQVVLSAVRATPPRAWLITAGILVGVLVALYWPLGSEYAGENPLWGFIPGLGHPQGYNMDLFTGGLRYWLGQEKVARGDQPFFYYFFLVPLYEQVAVVFGLWGLWYCLKRHTIFTSFVVWWTVSTWGFYIWASEKMPWLGLHLVIPLLVAASMVITRYVVHGERRGWRWYVPLAALVITGLTTVRGAQAMAYVNGDVSSEMMVYVQSSPDVPKTVTWTNGLAHALNQVDAAGKPTMRIAVDAYDAYTWPYYWYLRDYTPDNGWGSNSPDGFRASAANPQVQVMFISKTNYDGGAGQYVQHGWVGKQLVFNWWFPEDYKAYDPKCKDAGCGLPRLWGDLTGTPFLGNLWNWWLLRQPFDPQQFQTHSNARILYYLVRAGHDAQIVQSLGGGFEPLPVVTAVPTVTVPQSKVHAVTASLIVGSGGAGHVAFSQVVGVGTDAAHHLYVVDRKANQVLVFDAAGRLLTRWGSAGNGHGQFNQPSGVAVDGAGNVYVTDMWNGRVQKFTSGGAYITSWGTRGAANNGIGSGTGEFYGPRGIAVLPNGEIAVADTGNERIQVFTAGGTFVRAFGTRGSGAGQFNEPSSVTADSAGQLYVADYLNGRIQKFSAQGAFLAQWNVAGWGTPSQYDEPYLATDGAGRLIVPSPSLGQVLIYRTNGTLVAALGGPGAAPGQFSSPLGVAVSGHGLWVSDQGNARVQQVILP
ncbi:MAG: TIGR03663 family protein [Chloroflexota bacterium]